MESDLFGELRSLETDVDAAIDRLSGNKCLYITLLNGFKNDATMTVLNESIANKNWDEAFTAAHALKGLAGNMGFMPLFHDLGILVIKIRKGDIAKDDTPLLAVIKDYDLVLNAINGINKTI